MPTAHERRRHRQGAILVDVHATCGSPVASDYAIQIWYSRVGSEAGAQVETVTIPAGEQYGFKSLDGQVMIPFDSEVWPVLPDGPRPSKLVVVVGVDKPRR